MPISLPSSGPLLPEPVKGVGWGRFGQPGLGAEALALWQVKGPEGRLELSLCSNHLRMVVLLS